MEVLNKQKTQSVDSLGGLTQGDHWGMPAYWLVYPFLSKVCSEIRKGG